jgi:hypothetical protein
MRKPRNYGPGIRGIPSPVPAGFIRLRNRITGVIMECPADYVPFDPQKWERVG